MKKIAVITGASSGIGASFAQALAEKGCDLILIARRREKLRALCDLVRSSHGVSAHALVTDLSHMEEIQSVCEKMKELERVEYLVNCAGFGVEGYFRDVAVDKINAMLMVHIVAMVNLCRAVTPIMIRHNHGTIINVASMENTLLAPIAGSVIYGSTKAYQVLFSKVLQEELSKLNTTVKVQALCPGLTYSGFHDTEEYRGFDRSAIDRKYWMTADDVVAASLYALQTHQVGVCIPGDVNKSFYQQLTSGSLTGYDWISSLLGDKNLSDLH
ncbi:MAG: SDR family NAD(P)-dependent oxidoreductase [Chitinivibrionales bacterium]|nr:SDR family NAD(P)-dependent oxidoreductase [Chitinivibrionales bacterium]